MKSPDTTSDTMPGRVPPAPVQERFVLICHSHAICEQAEGVDQRRTDYIGVAQSQRLRRVVITGSPGCQQIIGPELIGRNRLIAADQITPKQSLFIRKLIIDPRWSLQLVRTQWISNKR